jgi:protein disulfide-isomerase A6
MMLPSSILLALLAALPANADGLYSKKSPVLNLNQKSYNALIANSNYTSVSQSLA